MKGQLRQSRVEVDDVRRQAAVTSDLQTALAEINGNQKELAAAVGGLQQSSIYISEWVQTLRAEAAELRGLVEQVRREQETSGRALAGDVAVLSEDCAGLRTKLGYQDSEIAALRESVTEKIVEGAAAVAAEVEVERREVQGVMAAVKTAMGRQNEQNQQVMQSLHSGQHRLQAQITDALGAQSDKFRRLDAAVGKMESGFSLKTAEMGRAIEDHVGRLTRHVEANDQAVRLVTDMMGTTLGGMRPHHHPGGGGENKQGAERGEGGGTNF